MEAVPLGPVDLHIFAHRGHIRPTWPLSQFFPFQGWCDSGVCQLLLPQCTGHSSMAAVFVGSVATPLALMTCPRYATSRRNKLDFLGPSLSPAQRNRLSTFRCQRMICRVPGRHPSTLSKSSMANHEAPVP